MMSSKETTERQDEQHIANGPLANSQMHEVHHSSEYHGDMKPWNEGQLTGALLHEDIMTPVGAKPVSLLAEVREQRAKQ